MNNKKYLLVLLIFFISFVLLKAYLHQPNISEIKNNDQIILDDFDSIKNLSEAIKFKTISHPDYEKFDYLEFQKFLNWLEAEYDLVFNHLEKKYLGKTLLLKWQGV